MLEYRNSYKEHYKEVGPEDTVLKLLKILEDVGISVEERWMDESEIGTFSMRLVIKGSEIGTNGKGVSREYARASAYAEFFERFQNQLLWREQWIECLKFPSNSDIIKTAEELVLENSSFIQAYFKAKNINDATVKEKIDKLLEVEVLEQFSTERNNAYLCTEFLNVTTNKMEYLPKSIYTPFYGSNGMCAGNSREEALVQGLSEIIERIVQKKAFLEEVTFPDIPDEKIQEYPYIWSMYTKLKEMKDIDATLKDCSFGGKYPVVALVIIKKNTGNYGVKFGCHPIISIAMERTLTEATQGQNVIQYSSSSYIDFTNKETKQKYNIENSMKAGIAQYPYQLFGNKPSFNYVDIKDYVGCNNGEILKKLLNMFKDDGFSVLIKDSSILGFPTYHIIIPGCSELKEITDQYTRANNTRLYATWLLSNLENVNAMNSKYISGAIENFALCIQENQIRSYFMNIGDKKLPAYKISCESSFLCAMCYCMQKKYKLAEYYIDQIVNIAKNEEDDQYYYYNAIKYYISAMQKWNHHEVAMYFIDKLFDKDISKCINETFIDNNNIISRIYEDTKGAVENKRIEQICMEKLRINKISVNQNELICIIN